MRVRQSRVRHALSQAGEQMGPALTHPGIWSAAITTTPGSSLHLPDPPPNPVPRPFGPPPASQTPSGLRPRSPELSHIGVCPLPPPRICHTHLPPQILRLSPPWEASSLGPGVLGDLLASGPPPSSLIRWNCTVIVSSSAQHPTPLGEAERQRRSALPSTRLRACSEFQISVDG